MQVHKAPYERILVILNKQSYELQLDHWALLCLIDATDCFVGVYEMR